MLSSPALGSASPAFTAGAVAARQSGSDSVEDNQDENIEVRI